jgi:hypothetical protein
MDFQIFSVRFIRLEALAGRSTRWASRKHGTFGPWNDGATHRANVAQKLMRGESARRDGAGLLSSISSIEKRQAYGRSGLGLIGSIMRLLAWRLEEGIFRCAQVKPTNVTMPGQPHHLGSRKLSSPLSTHPAGGNRPRVLTEGADGRFRSSGK